MTYKRPRNIFYVSDSFGRGFSLGAFSDQYSTTSALYEFSSPSTMANLVLRENNIPIRMSSGLTLDPAGLAISSIEDVNLPAAITTFIASGAVNTGDWFVFSDAGGHSSDPTAYTAAYRAVLQAAAGFNRLVLSIFDYPAVHMLGDGFSWDVAFSGTTMNQASAAAAAAEGVAVLDMNAIMDVYRSENLAASNLDPMLQVNGTNDGIHAGVWGQMKMVGAILADLDIVFPSIASVEAIASDNYTSLAAGHVSWTQGKAVQFCQAIYG